MNFIYLVLILTLSKIFSISFIDKTQLIFYVIPKNNSFENKNEKKDFFNVLYKGDIYTEKISSILGGQINILEEKIDTNFIVIVSQEVEILKDDNKEFVIKGIKIPKNINSKCYYISLSIQSSKNDIATYKWNITEKNTPEYCLPDNTIIIQSNPDCIELKDFDESFCPIYPSGGKNQFKGILFLPNIILDIEKYFDINEINNKLIEIKMCHGSK